MFALMFKFLFEAFLPRTPEVVCYQIGDNAYTCDAFWR